MIKSVPKISVWITCYNQEKYIEEAVQSVLDQTLRPYEILISDDCSTDDTPKILKEFECRYPDLVKVYYQSVRLGITKNKNFILNKVKGDYVTWLDGDDRFHPQKLEAEIQLLQQHSQADIVFSNVHQIDSEGKYIDDWINNHIVRNARALEKNESVTVEKLYYPDICFVNNQFSHLRNEMSTKRVLDTIGNFDENISLWQDWEFRLREFKHFKAVYCDRALSDYREHESAASKSPISIHFNDLIYIYNKHIQNIRNWRLQFYWFNALQGRKRDSDIFVKLKFPISIRLMYRCKNFIKYLQREMGWVKKQKKRR